MSTVQSITASPGKPLSELPNREGFKFRGIRKDGGRYMNCRLKHLPGLGMYITHAGNCYEDVTRELSGWEPHPSRQNYPGIVNAGYAE